MRKTLRTLYLVCMPFLFCILLAACLSFSGVVTALSSAEASPFGDVVLRSSTALDFDSVFFSLSGWEAKVGRTYQCRFDAGSAALTLFETGSGSSLELGGGQEIYLHLCAILGFLFFSLGALLSTVWRDLKTASGIGSGLLLMGTVLFFFEPSLSQGMHYELFFSSGIDFEEVFKMDAPWIDLRVVSSLASGLSLFHFFSLLKAEKSGNQMR